MNKKLIFELLMISALVVALISTTVFAASTSKTNREDGYYNSYAEAYVKVYYTTPGYYTGEEFEARRNPGSAQNDGPFYFCFFIDEEYYQGYEGSNSHPYESEDDCTLAATYTVADFKYGVQEWTCTALAALPHE